MVVAILGLAALLGWLVGRRWVAAGFAALLLAEAPAHVHAYAYAGGPLRFFRVFLFPWGFTIAPDIHEPVWLSVMTAIAIAGVAVWRWRKFSVTSEVTWVLIGLLLLIPSDGPNPAAVFAFAAAAGLLLARIPAQAAGIAVVIILAAISVSRTYVWASDERLWREAVRRSPESVEPKIQLAKSLRAADALDLLNRARQQAPDNAEIPAEIGRVLLDEQQYEAAVDELSRAVALDPRNALAFNNRGVALTALGQIPAAAADLQRALALDPHLDEARENLKRLGVR
jgi:tetratricopeptide (TPR) repeat protein